MEANQPTTSNPPHISSLTAPKVVTIAISGCSSSGKTTLAVILSAIFPHDTVAKMSQSLSITDFLNLYKEPLPMAKVAPIVIHEDAYFKDKSFCPEVSFRSTPGDVDFIQKTLAFDGINQYMIVYGDDTLLKRLPTRTATSSKDLTSAPMWHITGPDTDSYMAVDIPGLVQGIQHVQKTGSLSPATIRANKQTSIATPWLMITNAQREAILTEHADLIKDFKRFIKRWTNQQIKARSEAENGRKVARPLMLIVEGFLLLPDPYLSPVSPDVGSSSSSENRPLSSPSPENTPGLRSSKRNSSYAILAARKAAFKNTNEKAREVLMDQFNVKLFLPTSKDQAKKRRFARPCYIDRPDGQRDAGEMWKTEGYFEEVAWAHYEKEHKWLFRDGNIEGDIVQLSDDADEEWDDIEDDPVDNANPQVSRTQESLNGDTIVEGDAEVEGNTESKGKAVLIERHSRFCIPSDAAKSADVGTTVKWALEKILHELENQDWTVAADEPEGDSEIENGPTGVVYSGHDSGVVVNGDNVVGGVPQAQQQKKKKAFHGCPCF
ncbi:hypothetical protein D0Z07_3104 [Hyphodiscus hymeniophilus]|uniref:Uncharacterized protein n=1 Tax=Hyphodiscus hymeniophilus TaxID=353542 RepID=A0A9P6VLI4_9HELO|nr:hypothetical protein D0Z07_3104 [Hyphodiscus hymeniophilus]